MTPRRLLRALALAAFLPAAALAAGDDPVPRLPPGPHMGFIEGFDDLRPRAGEPDRRARAAALRERAIAAGMTIGRAQVDWRELEPSPGVFDARALDRALARARRGGMAVFVTFSTIDSESLTLPADLTGRDGMARGGLRLGGPVIVNRLKAFLDWFVPELTKRGVWGLALGNEVDTLIRDGAVGAADARAHLLAALAHARRLDPDLALTVTLTGDADIALPRFTKRLIAAFDIVSFNTYCLKRNLKVAKDPAAWKRVLRRWKRAAGDKPIFIQELGCPVGYGDDGRGAPPRPANGLGGSPALQARYIAFHMREFARDDQLRAATVFQLFDWSPLLARSFGQLVEADGEALAGRRLEEWLATVGLCRWADARCRPAWGEFRKGLRLLREARARAEAEGR